EAEMQGRILGTPRRTSKRRLERVDGALINRATGESVSGGLPPDSGQHSQFKPPKAGPGPGQANAGPGPGGQGSAGSGAGPGAARPPGGSRRGPRPHAPPGPRGDGGPAPGAGQPPAGSPPGPRHSGQPPVGGQPSRGPYQPGRRARRRP